ncbi:MAG: hydantoinase/oxoprolinase family protein [Blastocatellia bacterium]|nr:hydantoinase/oxoprolinase family protein [Blastocatellia bacterium]MDW8166885.1 hydantoinase/oxoprolinase family protein [Acidobacteriota bacterium]
MGYRLGIDVGGTFTDLLLFEEETGRLVLAKVPSTPSDPSIGVLAGIRKIAEVGGISPEAITLILHGTTVATNTVLEGKGALVGLITNKGFEQILHVARGQTPGPLAGWIIMIKPDPMAPLELTRGISARLNARGEEMVPLDAGEVEQALSEIQAWAQRLYGKEIEALAISLLHSYVNPAHEQEAKRIVERQNGHLHVTISSDILPEFREYERTLTTVMNAYVRPRMSGYLKGIREKLEAEGLSPIVNIVRSDGGVMSLEAAGEKPVNTLMSGPSGGVVAASYVGQLCGFPHVISFDMGGTSTDVAVSFGGRPHLARETRLGYYPVKVRSVDVRSIGAGGGSIAYVPITGALRVGPQSAGAEPGPACYGLGGEEPTVTDANVVLGHLPPKLLGGEMLLDVEAAERAVRKIAEAMGLDLYEAAQGILDIVNENMFGAIRLVTVQRGLDPRDFCLVAFGGAGPLHANALARLTGSWPVIVPPMPGVFSALGFLHTDIKNEFARTYIRLLDQTTPEEIKAHLLEVAEEARQWLWSEGIPPERQQIEYEIDVRYFRQGYEFPVHIAMEDFDSGAAFERLVAEFKRVHQQNYGFNLDAPIEIVNLRAIGIGVVRKLELPRFEREGSDSRHAIVEHHQIYFQGGFLDTMIYDRSRLRPGNVIPGPAVITQMDSTTVILPGHIGEVDEYLNILIWPQGEAGKSRQGRER